MCETTVYLERDGQREKLLDDVAKIVITPDGIGLTTLFDTPEVLRAELVEIDSVKHTAVLRPRDASPRTPDWVVKRRSIRAYTDAPVTEAEVQVLLEAAMAAPSANDTRPWAFVVVRDGECRRALAETHPWSAMCAQSPVVIAVLGDEHLSNHWIEDCSAATENLLLTASWLGLGAVWVAVYPRQEREDHVRRVLNVPARMRVLCLLPVGHPAEEKTPRTRYEQSKVHFETF